MRTLGTQVRLRRLVRVHADLFEHMSASDPEATATGAARLRSLIGDVWRAWQADLAAAAESGVDVAPELERHVRRALRAMDAAAAAVASPGGAQAGNLDWLRSQFREHALPLQFMLAGLDSQAPAAVHVLRGAA